MLKNMTDHYFDSDGFRLEFDEDVSLEERKFYMKIYSSVDQVSERKIHCTTCGIHIGTAPAQESIIRMHPVLKVTHCKKCHEFYNSGEFSKGEDGSELYCRWCGQGGEVYCCSKCPYVFCKNCIASNLAKGCVNDIEENENWNCFVCAPKIMWHLRAQHWALMNFIEKQKKNILSGDRTDAEIKKLMTTDSVSCCRTYKSKSGNVSDSSYDSESSLSKKRRNSNLLRKATNTNNSNNTSLDTGDGQPEPKKQKPNNEVVCTPDVMSMLQNNNTTPVVAATITSNEQPVKPTLSTTEESGILLVPQKKKKPTGYYQRIRPNPTATYTVKASTTGQIINQNPPPLLIRNINAPLRTLPATDSFRANTFTTNPVLANSVVANPVVANPVVANPNPISTAQLSPVYHTINGYRVDLNTASQQDTFRLPNGKLIQVKKQANAKGPAQHTIKNVVVPKSGTITINNPLMRPQAPPRTVQQNVIHTPNPVVSTQQLQQFPLQPQSPMTTLRYNANTPHVANAAMTAALQTSQGAVINQLINGASIQSITSRPTPVPTLIRQFFATTPLGQARTQLQNEIFLGMDICQHLTNKIHTLTNSNAYKSVRNYTDVKELYIHLSYLFTYAIGRFKSLQDKCMEDMRRLGFGSDAASLAKGNIVGEKSHTDVDDDIEIVEPKTTLIDLDSDNEDQTSPSKSKQSKKSSLDSLPKENDYDVTAKLLAGMLEVELHEGTGSVDTNQVTVESVPKKPRKKTTNKPNPHLIKQQELQQKEKQLENSVVDIKLRTACTVVLERIDETNELAKKIIEQYRINNELRENASMKTNESSELDETEILQEVLKIVETVDELIGEECGNDDMTQENPMNSMEEMSKMPDLMNMDLSTQMSDASENNTSLTTIVNEVVETANAIITEENNKNPGTSMDQVEISNAIVTGENNKSLETSIDQNMGIPNAIVTTGNNTLATSLDQNIELSNPIDSMEIEKPLESIIDKDVNLLNQMESTESDKLLASIIDHDVDMVNSIDPIESEKLIDSIIEHHVKLSNPIDPIENDKQVESEQIISDNNSSKIATNSNQSTIENNLLQNDNISKVLTNSTSTSNEHNTMNIHSDGILPAEVLADETDTIPSSTKMNGSNDLLVGIEPIEMNAKTTTDKFLQNKPENEADSTTCESNSIQSKLDSFMIGVDDFAFENIFNEDSDLLGTDALL